MTLEDFTECTAYNYRYAFTKRRRTREFALNFAKLMLWHFSEFLAENIAFFFVLGIGLDFVDAHFKFFWSSCPNSHTLCPVAGKPLCIQCTPLRAIFQPEAYGFSLIPNITMLAFQFLILFCGLATLSVFLAKFFKLSTLSNLQQVLL